MRLDLGLGLDSLEVVRGGSWEDLLGGGREVVLLDDRLLRGLVFGLASTLDQGLGLGGIVANVFLGELGSLFGLLLGNGAQLGSLGIDNITGLLELLVDELLVGLVDQGSEENSRGGNQGKAPGGDNLDEVVGQESTKSNLLMVSYSSRVQDQSSLELIIPSVSRGVLTPTEAARFSANRMR